MLMQVFRMNQPTNSIHNSPLWVPAFLWLLVAVGAHVLSSMKIRPLRLIPADLVEYLPLAGCGFLTTSIFMVLLRHACAHAEMFLDPSSGHAHSYPLGSVVTGIVVLLLLLDSTDSAGTSDHSQHRRPTNISILTLREAGLACASLSLLVGSGVVYEASVGYAWVEKLVAVILCVGSYMYFAALLQNVQFPSSPRRLHQKVSAEKQISSLVIVPGLLWSLLGFAGSIIKTHGDSRIVAALPAGVLFHILTRRILPYLFGESSHSTATLDYVQRILVVLGGAASTPICVYMVST